MKIKSNRKLRVIMDGVAIYGTKKFFTTAFGSLHHSFAFETIVNELEASGCTGMARLVRAWNGNSVKEVWVQVDLMDESSLIRDNIHPVCNT